jgi:hypothetical protein
VQTFHQSTNQPTSLPTGFTRYSTRDRSRVSSHCNCHSENRAGSGPARKHATSSPFARVHVHERGITCANSRVVHSCATIYRLVSTLSGCPVIPGSFKSLKMSGNAAVCCIPFLPLPGPHSPYTRLRPRGRDLGIAAALSVWTPNFRANAHLYVHQACDVHERGNEECIGRGTTKLLSCLTPRVCMPLRQASPHCPPQNAALRTASCCCCCCCCAVVAYCCWCCCCFVDVPAANACPNTSRIIPGMR